MSVETEVKIRLAEYDEFRRRLERLHPSLLEARHLEDNFLLDFPDARIRTRRCVVRVRLTGKRDLFTYKGPPQPSELFKSREEIETTVEDGGVILKVFERIGMEVWFRYQKYREEYALADPGAERDLHLAVDETPIGDFIELEGTEEGIRKTAHALGMTEDQFLRESYYALYVDSCRKRGEEPGHMVFPDVPAEGGTTE